MEISAAHKNGITIVVVGDHGSGKSSLIHTALSGTFTTNVPPVLPPTHLPDDILMGGVPTTIIDTSTSLEQGNKFEEELRRADAVVLTYAVDRPESYDRLSTYWLPKLRQLEVRVPVIIVGCKLDLRDDGLLVELDHFMSPIMKGFPEIDTCMECSACKHIQVAEVFYSAQNAVLYPIAPLFDEEMQTLRPQFVKALKRIFILCDHDKDGSLSDAELNNFQLKCFKVPLQPYHIEHMKRIVQQKMPEGVNESGLTLRGFVFLHAHLIERRRREIVWTVLRKFGYNNDIRLGDDLLPPSFIKAPDQSVELTSDAVAFLKGIFSEHDYAKDGRLRSSYVEAMFSAAPDCSWNEGPYKDAAPVDGYWKFLTLDGFLSEWVLLTLLDPAKSVEYLKYLTYRGDASSAIRLTRRRHIDREKKQSERNVFQCFVFGPKKAGKSTLLDAFLKRRFCERFYDRYVATTEERYAVNVVDGSLGSKKFLVLREIPEDKVKMLLSDKESLAACDVAIFVFDSSDELSWKKTAGLLVEVSGHGKDMGYEVPSLIVAAKNDSKPHSTEIHDSTRFSQAMGIEAPIAIDVTSWELNDIFERIVSCAEHPHLGIPDIEAWRSTKHILRLVNRSLVYHSDSTTSPTKGSLSEPLTSLMPLLPRPRSLLTNPGALWMRSATVSPLRPPSRFRVSRSVGVVALAGLAAYRVYAARRNSSR